MERAAQRKLDGQEVTEAPTEERKGKVIDLMAALKASLEKRGATGAARAEEREAEHGSAEPGAASADAEAEAAKATGTGGGKTHARARRAGGGESRRAGGKK